MAEIKPYNKKQLSSLYNVSTLTLRSWLKPFSTEIGQYNGKCYTIAQIQIIFSKIGNP